MVWTLGANKLRSLEPARGVSKPLSEMAEPYVDYLESVFFYYGENVRAAEKLTPKGSNRLLRGSCRWL